MKSRIALPLALLLSVALQATGALAGPLVDAASRNDADTVRSLLQSGADVNEAQGDGMTALHWASETGNAEVARMLLYAGSNLEAGTRIGNYTPLHIASRNGHTAVVAALIEAGADVNAVTTNSGATPLHLAAASGNAEAVDRLIAAGAIVLPPKTSIAFRLIERWFDQWEGARLAELDLSGNFSSSTGERT